MCQCPYSPGVVNRARAAVACPIREEKGGGPVFTCWDRSNSVQGKKETACVHVYMPAWMTTSLHWSTCIAVATTQPNFDKTGKLAHTKSQ